MFYSEKELSEKLEVVIEHFKDRIKQISTGKPNTEAIEDVRVEAYGGMTRIQAVGQVIVEDAVTVKVQIWDKGVTQVVEKALRESDLGASVSVDSGLIRLKFNPITEEDRKSRVKDLGKYTEDAKVQVRGVRQDFNKKVDNEEGVSEDDQKRDKEAIQKSIDEAIARIDEISKKKEDDLLTV